MSIILVLLCIAAVNSAPPYKQGRSDGMTVLLAVYGSNCGHVTDQPITTQYAQSVCDGHHYCKGAVDVDIIGDPHPGCSKDFAVVAICQNGDIRSDSLTGDAGGKNFTIDCLHEDLPETRKHADWMNNMTDTLWTKRLLDAHMPGTHNTATHSIKAIGNELSKCQNIPTGQQLIGGVRYVDFRFGSKQNVWGARVVHGIHWGQLAIQALLEVWAFAEMHPREFLLVDIQHSSSLTADMKDRLSVWITDLFGDSAIKRGSIQLSKATFGEMWTSGEHVLITHQSPGSNLEWYRSALYSPWANVCTGKKLVPFADDLLERVEDNGYLDIKFVILQWIITPAVTCPGPLYPRSMAIRPGGEDWIRNNDYPFPVIMMDFMHDPVETLGVIEQIINSNKP